MMDTQQQESEKEIGFSGTNGTHTVGVAETETKGSKTPENGRFKPSNGGQNRKPAVMAFLEVLKRL